MADDWKRALLDDRPEMGPPPTDDEPGDGAALKALMEASGGRCWYCGCQMTFGVVGTSITREHLLPTVRGGSNKRDNIVGACRSCNVRKQGRTVEEYRSSLAALTGQPVVFYGEQSR